jgi:predicted ATPase/signal transduction histidine kinase
MKPIEYHLSLLREGELRLYRRSQEGTESVLVVVPASEDAECLARLQHELSIRAGLDARWATIPVALTRCNDQVALVLDDPGGELLRNLCDSPMEMGMFLPLATSLATAVKELHARNLIHRNISPDNILVDAINGRAWLTGFGFAVCLAGEDKAPDGAALNAGAFAYMAPEQSGRMSLPVDIRSDLYTLGCTFYEMLTAKHPLAANNPVTWVHNHVARQPVPPKEHVISIPEQISAIVVKLLAKDPEERYQSAASLLVDLDRCLSEWRKRLSIDVFSLDMQNVSHRLKISERLYGRELETHALLSAFERVAAQGKSEWVLVSGYSGSGKSTLVRQLHDRLHLRAHLFASGKCEQVKSAIPYAGLAQALQSLVRSILGRHDKDFEIWRARLLDSLGSNVRLLSTLIPELELILGEQTPMLELPSEASKISFLRTASRLLTTFASAEQPLVLFLDDLQWMDVGTQAVIEYLVNEEAPNHLLLIGAYRSNELASEHPLRHGYRDTRIPIRELTLAPLRVVDLAQLVSDSFACTLERATPLAELVLERTRGNPFFAIHFIAALVEEGMIAFDQVSMSWDLDLVRIRDRAYSENPTDLVLRKLDLLPAATQSILKCLACLGSGATARTLGVAASVSRKEVDLALEEPCRANLVRRIDDRYVFWHDRIQEAAYASISGGERDALHLEIGRRLLALSSVDMAGDMVFETANQINRGSALVTLRDERRQLARLNLLAGQRAKAATAYSSALTYFVAASDLLARHADEDVMDHSDDHEETVHAVEFHLAECEFLTGELLLAESRLTALSRCRLDLQLRADLTCLRTVLYTTMDRPHTALEVSLEYLGLVGEDVPSRPTDEDVEKEFLRMRRLIGEREVRELRDLPLMWDPVWRGTMNVYAELIPAALFTDAKLHDLIRLRMTNLSLEHGHCDASAYAYVALVVVFSQHDDYVSGYQFGELARYLVNERDLSRFKARVEMSFATLVLPWTMPVKTGQSFMLHALQSAFKTGDLTFEVYCRRNLVSNFIFAGAPVSRMLQDAEANLQFVQERKFGLVVDALLAQIIMFRRLLGLPLDAVALLEAGYDRPWVECYARGEVSSRAIAAFSFWTHLLQTSVLFNELPAAINAEEKAGDLYWSSRSFIETAEFHFYGALARATAIARAGTSERGLHLAALRVHHDRLLIWTKNCPENFACRATLVEAEICRLENRLLDAEHLYEDAIRQAREQGFVQNEGLANELAARFYAGRGLDTIGRAYLRQARRAYFLWGAHGKVADIDRQHPYLQTSPLENPPAFPASGTSWQLDVGAVLKASHALSGEIVLSKLVKTLMVNVLEHAGAQRCVLVLAHGPDLWIEAESCIGAAMVDVALQRYLVSPQNLPASILQTVMRTQKCIVLDDARDSGNFTQDDYIQRERPRSILCVPLINQSQFVGLVYIENNLTSGAFTAERTTVLEVLASQAAISLENARLYAQLVDENRQRERAENSLRNSQAELARVARLTTMGELVASIVHEVSQPIAAVGTCATAAMHWLDRAPPEIGEAREMLERIVSDTTRAKEVIRGLRSLARKASPEFATFDLNESIREVLVLIHGQLEANGVELDQDLIQGECLVNGDRVQLQQVVLNLVVNGIEAMRGVVVRKRLIEVSTQPSGRGRVVIAVADNGTGLDSSIAERIFQPFVTTKTDGMGMGLSICRTIVEAHGGRLTASPRSRGGTVFTFTVHAPGNEGGDTG